MPGPMPKDLALRQRRNKSSTRAVFVIQEKPPKNAPRLPKLYHSTIEDGLPVAHEEQWHPMALKLWKDIWASPMKNAFLHVDQAALFRRVYLEHQYWQHGTSLAVAAEIRQLDRVLGLTPMSRRSLEWVVVWDPDAGKRETRKPAEVIDGTFSEHDDTDLRSVLEE